MKWLHLVIFPDSFTVKYCEKKSWANPRIQKEEKENGKTIVYSVLLKLVAKCHFMFTQNAAQLKYAISKILNIIFHKNDTEIVADAISFWQKQENLGKSSHSKETKWKQFIFKCCLVAKTGC